MSRTVRPLLALILLSTIGLGGCAAKTSGPEVQQFVASIDQGMTGVTSYRGTVSMDIDGGRTSGTMTGSMEGTVSGGEAVDSRADIDLVIGSTRVGVEVLMIGSQTYVGGSTILDAVPAASGKQWILADPRSSNSTVRAMSESMSSMSTNSITGMVAFVDATTSISNEGAESINGVSTTRYDVELDPEKIPDTAAGDVTADSVDASLFVDDQGRMRRAVIELSMDEASAELTIDVTDYNVDVDVDKPVASAVYTG